MTVGTPAGNPQRRWSLSSGWAKAALIVAAVAGLLAVCIFVLPTPLARWAVSRQLDKMGISFQGLRTLDVDLAQGEVWLGPVQFSASQREPAQLAEFGFDASLSSLWRKRVLFDRMIVRGLDIHVRRVLDGPITINGIALTQFLQNRRRRNGRTTRCRVRLAKTRAATGALASMILSSATAGCCSPVPAEGGC
ncbi:MAG: hypothetical protein IPK78_19335 [Rhodospirillales bacterium]|nr:hypothetical protein [Rhodospirillales bacterium]